MVAGAQDTHYYFSNDCSVCTETGKNECTSSNPQTWAPCEQGLRLPLCPQVLARGQEHGGHLHVAAAAVADHCRLAAGRMRTTAAFAFT